MKKISDRLDFFDKMLDLRNNYIENQKQCIENEIRWLENNIENTDNLRFYFANSLHMEWAMKLNKNDIQQVAEMRGNNLYALLHEMDRQKTETKPLKVIVQELKYLGQ